MENKLIQKQNLSEQSYKDRYIQQYIYFLWEFFFHKNV